MLVHVRRFLHWNSDGDGGLDGDLDGDGDLDRNIDGDIGGRRAVVAGGGAQVALCAITGVLSGADD